MCVLEIRGSSSEVLFYLRIIMAMHHSLNLGSYISGSYTVQDSGMKES